MSFQAFRRILIIYVRDYVIEWDKNFADDLNVVASLFLSHSNLMAHYFLSTFDATRSLKTKMKTNMGCRTSGFNSGGDLAGNNRLAQAFLQSSTRRRICYSGAGLEIEG